MADTDEALKRLLGLRRMLMHHSWTHKGKGGQYLVVDLCLDKTNDKITVLYRNINPIGRLSPFCTRTIDNFFDRFEILTEEKFIEEYGNSEPGT